MVVAQLREISRGKSGLHRDMMLVNCQQGYKSNWIYIFRESATENIPPIMLVRVKW